MLFSNNALYSFHCYHFWSLFYGSFLFYFSVNGISASVVTSFPTLMRFTKRSSLLNVISVTSSVLGQRNLGSISGKKNGVSIYQRSKKRLKEFFVGEEGPRGWAIYFGKSRAKLSNAPQKEAKSCPKK